jgi:hypothetical protein
MNDLLHFLFPIVTIQELMAINELLAIEGKFCIQAQ